MCERLVALVHCLWDRERDWAQADRRKMDCGYIYPPPHDKTSECVCVCEWWKHLPRVRSYLDPPRCAFFVLFQEKVLLAEKALLLDAGFSQ